MVTGRMKRVIAIGDIHGCLSQLKALLNICDPKQDDQLIFLGDYISRGPDSRGVIDFLVHLSCNLPGAIFLKGNHEEMLLNYLAGHEKSKFILNNGENFLKDYATNKGPSIPDDHLNFLNSLELCYQYGEYFFVHAGVSPGKELLENEVKDFLWIRDKFIQSDYVWSKKIIFGHTSFSDPLIMHNKIGIDTGACFGNKLTAYEVSSGKFYQI